MIKKTFHLTSLGCAKNTVDSESMAQLLINDGYKPVLSPRKADILIVNTCGFIAPARQESYAVLQELAKAKRSGQRLIAAGCLSQRYGEEISHRVPGVDGILGTRRWMDILQVVDAVRPGGHPNPQLHLPSAARVGIDERGALRASIAGGSAYLKIADGCHRPCAFCAIPLIKGPQVSRPPQVIIQEALQLSRQGVREIILIAQDTTAYGRDLGMKDGLPELLVGIIKQVPATTTKRTGLDWIRIMYAFPGAISDRLVEVMSAHPRVVPYIDIPLQHAHPKILRSMKRPARTEWVRKMVSRLRQTLPQVAIRTTFIVGFPGETEAEFQVLCDFIREMRFDRLGVFPFSYEQDTASAPLGDPIPEEIKEERRQRLMEIQQAISLQINQTYVGQTLDVLVEGKDRDLTIGRSFRDAPEIDGLVLAEGNAQVGSLVPVRITGALAYDLTGILQVPG